MEETGCAAWVVDAPRLWEPEAALQQCHPTGSSSAYRSHHLPRLLEGPQAVHHLLLQINSLYRLCWLPGFSTLNTQWTGPSADINPNTKSPYLGHVPSTTLRCSGHDKVTDLIQAFPPIAD